MITLPIYLLLGTILISGFILVCEVIYRSDTQEFNTETNSEGGLKSSAVLELENTPTLFNTAGRVQIIQEMLENGLVTKKQVKTIFGLTLEELGQVLNQIITAKDQEFILNAKKKQKSRRRKLQTSRRDKTTKKIKPKSSKRIEEKK
jgi:hypothetical protein